MECEDGLRGRQRLTEGREAKVFLLSTYYLGWDASGTSPFVFEHRERDTIGEW